MVDKTAAARLLEEMFPQKPKEPTFGERVLSGQAPQQAEMRPYDPTIREQAATLLQRGMERLGTDRYKARQRAETVVGGPSSNLPLGMGFADILPFVGTTFQTQEAGRALESAGEAAKRGDYVGAAVEGGMGALGLVPGALGVARYARPVGEMTASALSNLPRAPGALANLAFSGPAPGSMAAQRGAINLGGPQVPDFKPQGFEGLLSRADEALAALPRSKGTGAEFLRELQKTPGVKPAELEDRGLIDALSGMGKVTKADVLKVLQDNPPVQFEEVVLGGTGKLPDNLQNYYENSSRAVPQTPEGWVEHSERMERVAQQFQRQGQIAQADRMFELAQEMGAMAERLDTESGRAFSASKFSKYTIPGGENYREILLTVPPKQLSVDEARKVLGAKPDANLSDADIYYASRKNLDEYRSQHWEQPNVLAHARISDRTGPNGEKILHVEEVQSDWHQTGRKEGYKTGKEKEQISALSKQYDELTSRRRQLLKQAEEMPDGGPEFISLIDESNAITPQLMRLQEQMDTLRSAGDRGVPDAPFKKNWHELMMKRLVDYAVKNGYDRIAITPGAEQASRYDLSKHINKIEFTKDPSGEYSLVADDKNGREVINRLASAKELPDLVGKELAQKIVEQGEGSLTGLDLKIGGEGMKGFYDKILPTYLNELGKPYGVKVGQMEIEGGSEMSRGPTGRSMVPTYTPKTVSVHSFDITPQMREAIKSKGLPLYKKGGAVRISDNPDTMNLELMMAEGGSPRQKLAKAIASGVKSLAKPAEKKSVLESLPKEEAKPYTEKQVQSTAEKLAPKIQKENPKLSAAEVEKRALRQAEQKLKWEKVEKPELESSYGALEKAKFSQSRAERLRNVPEVVEKRIQETRDFLKEPTEPWQPPRKELQAFERERIKEALEGFPGVEQTRFPRYQPARADLSYIDEIYDDPVNRELIKGQIARGLPLGGETFYASLYPLKLAALDRGIPEEKFNQFIYSIAPASARNSIMNEMAVGQFMRDMYARGLPLDEATVSREMAEFAQKYGKGLPLMPVHREGVKNVLEGQQDLREMLKADIPTNYKIPTYGTQKAGDFGKSMVLDVHESAGQTRGSRYHPYFTEQGGFGPTEYGAAEGKMLDIAGEMGIPGGMAQAGRWFGGGELTGLVSPRGDALDLLEKQAAYTLNGMGVKPTPRNVRNYILDMIDTGQGVLMPWYSKTKPMPDVRTEKKKGGAVRKPRGKKVEITDNLDAMRLAVQK